MGALEEAGPLSELLLATLSGFLLSLLTNGSFSSLITCFALRIGCRKLDLLRFFPPRSSWQPCFLLPLSPVFPLASISLFSRPWERDKSRQAGSVKPQELAVITPLLLTPDTESRSWRLWRRRRGSGRRTTRSPCLLWARPCHPTSLWAWRWSTPSFTLSSSSSSTSSSGWSCGTDTSASATRPCSCFCACCGRRCAPCFSPSTSRTLSRPTLWDPFPSGCSIASPFACSSSRSASWTCTLRRWVAQMLFFFFVCQHSVWLMREVYVWAKKIVSHPSWFINQLVQHPTCSVIMN